MILEIVPVCNCPNQQTELLFSQQSHPKVALRTDCVNYCVQSQEETDKPDFWSMWMRFSRVMLQYIVSVGTISDITGIIQIAEPVGVSSVALHRKAYATDVQM